MARLQQIRPRLDGLTRRLSSGAAGPDRLAVRDKIVGWRRWYKTAEWQRLRWDCLVAATFTCVMCGRNGGADTSKLVADHIEPHRGERDLFYDPSNLQCLCKPCHDGTKQRQERRSQGEML